MATEIILTPSTERALAKVAKTRGKMDRAKLNRDAIEAERDAAILAAIESGASLRVVAQYAGITHETVRAAAARARAAEPVV